MHADYSVATVPIFGRRVFITHFLGGGEKKIGKMFVVSRIHYMVDRQKNNVVLDLTSRGKHFEQFATLESSELDAFLSFNCFVFLFANVEKARSHLLENFQDK